MEDKVKEALDQIRPSLQNDGGDIELVKVEGKDVYVRLTGHCAGCMMSQITLKKGVEAYLKNYVDEEITVYSTN